MSQEAPPVRKNARGSITLKESKDFVKRMDIVGTGKPQKCNMLLSELLSENGVSDILEVTDIWRN